MGRMSAYVLIGLPFFVLGAVTADQRRVHGPALPHAHGSQADDRHARDDRRSAPCSSKKSCPSRGDRMLLPSPRHRVARPRRLPRRRGRDAADAPAAGLDPPRRALRRKTPQRRTDAWPRRGVPRPRGRAHADRARPRRPPGQPEGDARRDQRQAPRSRAGPAALADHLPRREGHPRRSAGSSSGSCSPARARAAGKELADRRAASPSWASSSRTRGSRSRPRRARSASRPSCRTRSTCSPSASRPGSASTARSRS